MPTIFMLRGLPASGKTTIAKQMVDERGCKRVNRDELRAMVDNGQYSPESEKLIKAIRDSIISDSILEGYSVVIDDANLKPADESNLRYLARMCMVGFEIVSVDTPLDECIRRDSLREKPVGEQAIRDLYENYVVKQES